MCYQIAKEIGLVTADKKDSQGLCFIGKVSLPTFLQQQLEPKEVEIVEIVLDLDEKSSNCNIYAKSLTFSPLIVNEFGVYSSESP